MDGRALVAPAGLEQQHADVAVDEPARRSGTGRSAADDDDVGLEVAGAPVGEPGLWVLGHAGSLPRPSGLVANDLTQGLVRCKRPPPPGPVFVCPSTRGRSEHSPPRGTFPPPISPEMFLSTRGNARGRPNAAEPVATVGRRRALPDPPAPGASERVAAADGPGRGAALGVQRRARCGPARPRGPRRGRRCRPSLPGRPVELVLAAVLAVGEIAVGSPPDSHWAIRSSARSRAGRAGARRCARRPAVASPARCVAESRAPRASAGPTTPSTVRPWRRWKRRTAARVRAAVDAVGGEAERALDGRGRPPPVAAARCRRGPPGPAGSPARARRGGRDARQRRATAMPVRPREGAAAPPRRARAPRV